MNLGFREKRLWVDLLATAGIGAYYVFNLATFGTEKLTDIHAVMGLLWNVVVLCIVVDLISWTALRIHDKKSADAPLDEREHLAELKATDYGYAVLKIAIAGTVVLYGLEIASIDPNGGDYPAIRVPPYTALHVIVASYVVSDIVVTVTQLFGLRRDL